LAKRLTVVDADKCVGCQSCMFACNRRFSEAGFSRSAIHVKSAGGVEHGFVVVVCRACQDPPCMKVCPTNALTHREGGGVNLDMKKCIGCQNCLEACPFGAITWDEITMKPVICVYCGYCEYFCPYDVIRLEPIER